VIGYCAGCASSNECAVVVLCGAVWCCVVLCGVACCVYHKRMHAIALLCLLLIPLMLKFFRTSSFFMKGNHQKEKQLYTFYEVRIFSILQSSSI
jgi:hypothetical protein